MPFGPVLQQLIQKLFALPAENTSRDDVAIHIRACIGLVSQRGLARKVEQGTLEARHMRVPRALQA